MKQKYSNRIRFPIPSTSGAHYIFDIQPHKPPRRPSFTSGPRLWLDMKVQDATLEQWRHSREIWEELLSIGSLLHLARHVVDVSPTSPNVAKSWPTLLVVATQKRPRHTQFSSITANKYRSAQTYELATLP